MVALSNPGNPRRDIERSQQDVDAYDRDHKPADDALAMRAERSADRD